MDKPTFNILGDIVASSADAWYESDVSPAMVIGWLRKQGGADVEININSLGGDVTGGLAICNAIKGYPGKVTANILGVAASMASVIACACDAVTMGQGAFMMIHNPWTITVGDAETLRHEAETLEVMRDSIISFYQTKTTKSAEELKALMDAETWIADTDAAEYGFSFAPYADDFKAAATLSRRSFASAPEAAAKFFAKAETPHAQSDWQARLSGLQAAKDKELAALRDELNAARDAAATEKAQMEADYNAKLNALTADRDALKAANDNLTTEIGAKTEALAAAESNCKQLETKYAETSKTLAETQAALIAETDRYRAQIGGALQPPEELPTLDAALAKCATPAERSALIASGKYKR